MSKFTTTSKTVEIHIGEDIGKAVLELLEIVRKENITIIVEDANMCKIVISPNK